MCAAGLLLVNFMMVLFGRLSATPKSHCDQSTTARVNEGNLGQTPDFNWLGVLRVHLQDGDGMQVAVSGIVLIKVNYVLANADDVVRIPQRVFLELHEFDVTLYGENIEKQWLIADARRLKTKEELNLDGSDTRAMFIPTGDQPWFARPASYSTHPEYEYATYNTIAVVELKVDDAPDVDLNPICFPTGSFNTSRFLYLTGYTDENQLLEKVIYRIKYLEKSACEEFYDRAGLSDQKRVPTSYLCGFSPFNSSHCVWDNGMVLVSNATGWFTLVGLGIRGPGCAAPARFIDLSPYYSWINTVSGNQDEIYDDVDTYRKRNDGEIQFIPTHDLFTEKSTRREYEIRGNDTFKFIPYPFTAAGPRPTHFNVTSEDGAIAIYRVNETGEQYPGACTEPKILMYQEYFELNAAPGVVGSVVYKLSFYDLVNKICVCAKIKINTEHREEAILSFKEEIHFDHADASQEEFPESVEMSQEVFIHYPITERILPPRGNKTTIRPPYLKPTFITDNPSIRRGKVLNYDLLIKFDFEHTTIMKFELYAAANPKEVNSSKEADTVDETAANATTEAESLDDDDYFDPRPTNKNISRSGSSSNWGKYESEFWPGQIKRRKGHKVSADEVLSSDEHTGRRYKVALVADQIVKDKFQAAVSQTRRMEADLDIILVHLAIIYFVWSKILDCVV